MAEITWTSTALTDLSEIGEYIATASNNSFMKNAKDEVFNFSEANSQIGLILASAISIEETISEIIINFFKPRR